MLAGHSTGTDVNRTVSWTVKHQTVSQIAVKLQLNNSPPSLVSVMNVKCVLEEPATLCASICSWYTDAGLRPEMMNLLCGFKALDTVTDKPDGRYLYTATLQQTLLYFGNYCIFRHIARALSIQKNLKS
jgi:hypothetical protein